MINEKGEVNMKNKKLIFIIIGIIIMMLVLITINVQASSSLKATIESSKNMLSIV